MADWLATMWELLLDSSLIALVLFWTLGPASIVLIHELGHAAAVRARGLRLDMLSVGDREDVLIRAGRTVLRFGRPDRGAWSGFVTLDPDASPEDVIVIALAGPLANLLTAPLFAAAAASGATHGDADLALWILAVLSVITGVGNLIPIGTPGEADDVSDGGYIRFALAVRAGRPLPEAPAEPAETAEPAEPVVAAVEEGTFRAPFKIALALVILASLVAGGLAAAAAVAVPIAILLGAAYFTGAHRQKLF